MTVDRFAIILYMPVLPLSFGLSGKD